MVFLTSFYPVFKLYLFSPMSFLPPAKWSTTAVFKLQKNKIWNQAKANYKRNLESGAVTVSDSVFLTLLIIDQ